jgi:cation:H+ antiporter
MASALLQFVITAAVIVVAGTVLTRCADAIAERTGLGRLIAGSIFLAFATSLPELLVDLNAVRIGLPDLAVGDLMGSSLFNLLILGAMDLVHRTRGRLLSHASAAHALSGTMSIAQTALAAIALLLAARLAPYALAGMNVGVLAIAAAYVLGVRIVYYDQRRAAAILGVESPGGTAPPESAHAATPTLTRALAGYVAAAAAIIVAAPFLARAAGRLAELTGLGQTFIGTTLVALSTSLPELVATWTAVRMGAFDLALGNIFGSNAFNMVLLAPLDLAYPGSLLAAASPAHAVTALATILITAVVIIGQLYQVERRIRFLEPDAVLVILLVLGALALIYYFG